MKTNVERIQRDIENLAQFTCVEGIGCTRFTYTKEFAGARDYIVSEMKAAGLEVREDAVGIIIGRMEGKNPDAPVVMTGFWLPLFIIKVFRWLYFYNLSKQFLIIRTLSRISSSEITSGGEMRKAVSQNKNQSLKIPSAINRSIIR